MSIIEDQIVTCYDDDADDDTGDDADDDVLMLKCNSNIAWNSQRDAPIATFEELNKSSRGTHEKLNVNITPPSFQGFCNCLGCHGYNIHFCGIENNCSCSKIFPTCGKPSSSPKYHLAKLQPDALHIANLHSNSTKDSSERISLSELAAASHSNEISNDNGATNPSYASTQDCSVDDKVGAHLCEREIHPSHKTFRTQRPMSSIEMKSGDLAMTTDLQESLKDQLRRKVSSAVRLETQHVDLPATVFRSETKLSRSSNSDDEYLLSVKPMQNRPENPPFGVEATTTEEVIDFTKWKKVVSMKTLRMKRKFKTSKLCDLALIKNTDIIVATDAHSTYICQYGNDGNLINDVEMDSVSGWWGIALNYRGNYVITDCRRGLINITDKKFKIIKRIYGRKTQQEIQQSERKDQRNELWKTEDNFELKPESPRTKKCSCISQSKLTSFNMPNHINMVEPRYVVVNSRNQILITDTVLKSLIAINPDNTIAFSTIVGTKICRECTQRDSKTFHSSTTQLVDELSSVNESTNEDKNNSKTPGIAKLLETQNKPKSCLETLFSNITKWTKKNEPSIFIDVSFKRLAGDSNEKLTNISNNKTPSKSVAFSHIEHFGGEISVDGSSSSLAPDNRQDCGNLFSKDSPSSTLSSKCHPEICFIPKMDTYRDSLMSYSIRRNTVSTVPCQTLKEEESNVHHQCNLSNSITRLPCSKCKFGDPRGICIDSYDNILVADQVGNAISLYNRDGQFQRVVLSQENNINEPRQMKPVNHQSLAVIDGSNTIKIFKFK